MFRVAHVHDIARPALFRGQLPTAVRCESLDRLPLLECPHVLIEVVQLREVTSASPTSWQEQAALVTGGVWWMGMAPLAHRAWATTLELHSRTSSGYEPCVSVSPCSSVPELAV